MLSNTELKKISHHYNQHQILNLISILHKKRVLLHIQKFLIWMIQKPKPSWKETFMSNIRTLNT